MSAHRIESTGLWINSLSDKIEDNYSTQRDELRTSFLKFRSNASHLVSQIATHLPGLTRHDASHLDALWETASIITGENYSLNALEGFVLGGAILLHDSALCFEAYDNGIEGVRQTTIWRDAYYAASESNTNLSENDYKDIADFSTLRHLHASQAAKLIEKKWIDPDTKQEIYLIENTSLRKHLGQLIGQIAASHHWEIERVATLPIQINSLAGFPRDWRINPIKIACILRCADAAHIDNERAPDFLYALLKRQGVSFNHWQAQNRLSNVDIDQSDPSGSTILFTSTRNFPEEDSDSWWVAYDAALVVDKEIRESNALLESKSGNNSTFKVKRVRGIESPEIMASYIKTEGWTPCSAKLHVGNIEKLVKSLGGENLYGRDSDKVSVVIRELIQNARDAIKARQIIDSNFESQILIKLIQKEGDSWLIVEDNGVGMTERVLTGPLLDFGTSFWKSSLVQTEFPGLLSSKFKATGQFGIGFYSIFMVSNEVYVTSKPWQGGTEDIRQLYFKNGLSLRPLLKKGFIEHFAPSTSTQVYLKLNTNVLDKGDKIEIKRSTINSSNLLVEFADYLSVICAGLDESVYYVDDKGLKHKIHTSIYSPDFDKQAWMEKISFSQYQESTSIRSYIEDNHKRLTFIVDEGRILGLAAISTHVSNEQDFLNIRTVGGLATTVHSRDSRDYIGFIDFLPESASRNGSINSFTASQDSIRNWANEQIQLLNFRELDPYARFTTASSLCSFKVDPTDVAIILIVLNRKNIFLTFESLANLADITDIAIFKSGHMDHAETYHDINSFDGYALIRPLLNGSFISLTLENGVPADSNSLIGCLHRVLIGKGKTPIWSVKKSVANSYFGPMDALVVSIKRNAE